MPVNNTLFPVHDIVHGKTSNTWLECFGLVSVGGSHARGRSPQILQELQWWCGAVDIKMYSTQLLLLAVQGQPRNEAIDYSELAKFIARSTICWKEGYYSPTMKPQHS